MGGEKSKRDSGTEERKTTRREKPEKHKKKRTTNKKRRGTTEKQMKKGVRGRPENPSVVPKNGKPKEGRIQKNT